jgi:hypothetical protein
MIVGCAVPNTIKIVYRKGIILMLGLRIKPVFRVFSVKFVHVK